MRYQHILDEIYAELEQHPKNGKAAAYIPELSKIDPDKFGMYIVELNGHFSEIGDSREPFSIQSISKVLSLTLATALVGKDLLSRVGVEPSGDPFNSLTQLEYENGIPRNPLINAGALVISDILISHLDNPKQDFLNFVRKLANNPFIDFDEKVAASEKIWGYRNAALVNLMKSFGNINNDIEEILDFYFHQCSIAMTCQELAQTFLVFANHGILTYSGEQIITRSQAKRINAIMQTCGFYDEAGEFTFSVGLPGKSGVGGGIVAVLPTRYSVAVWSPRLNPKGNSELGMKALELLTTKTGYSIF